MGAENDVRPRVDGGAAHPCLVARLVVGALQTPVGGHNDHLRAIPAQRGDALRRRLPGRRAVQFAAVNG